MTQNNTHTTQKRRKWPWLVIGIFLVLIIAIRYSLTTATVHNLVKSQIESVANAQLKVPLTLGEVKGDLWKEITLTDIRLKDDTTTVASIDSVHAKYNVWSYFSSAFKVTELTISKPFVKVEQHNTAWNFSSWINSSQTEPTGGDPFSVVIDSLKMNNGRVDAYVESLPQDSAFSVSEMSLSSSIAYYGDDFEVGITGLSFNILSSSLGDPVRVQSAANANEQAISLQKLVVATGNSVLQTTGMISLQDSSSQLKLQAKPLSWKDVAIFSQNAPIRQDVSARLNLSGNTDLFNIGLDVQADGLEQFALSVDLTYDSSLILKAVNAEAAMVDLAVLSGDSTLPKVRDFSLSADGEVPLNDLEKAQAEANLQAQEIYYEGYLIDELSVTANLKDGELSSKLSALSKRQKVSAKARVSNLFTEVPKTDITISANNFNPGYWLKEETFTGAINLVANASGKGFYPENDPWQYSIRITNSVLMQQNFSLARFKGKISRQAITNTSLIRLDESELQIKAEAHDLASIPSFNYSISSQNFDLAECRGMEDFSSSISASITGNGRGNTLQNVQLNSTVKFDSSVVNGEFINQLGGEITIKDTVATVKNAKLMSTIADGSFEASLHLTDPYRTTNNLGLDMQVKDVQSLAPLLGTDRLLARGAIQGDLSPIYEGELKFSGNLNLSNINYDESYTASRAEGNIEVFIIEQPEFVLDLNLTSPGFSGVSLRDFNIQTRGKVKPERIDGNFDLTFTAPNQGQINHSGTYKLAADSTVLETTKLDFISSERTLSLKNRFELMYANDAIQMDTLMISSGDSASLTMAIPYADSLKQRVYVEGKNLDLAVMQRALLDDPYVEGIMSGAMRINRDDTVLTADGDLTLAQITYRQTVLDTLNLKLNISDGYLNSTLSVINQNRKIVDGSIRVPFTMHRPQTIGDAFFNQPVDGYLRIDEVALSDFDELLNEEGITDTRGTLSFNGELKGRAGMPEFSGDLNINKAVLSGIESDSVTADFSYNHEDSQINLNAAIYTLKQKAADVNAQIPFNIDLLTFQVAMPQESDQVAASLETNNFNLAALNDFFNPDQIRDIKGRLNGTVEVFGPAGNLKTEGELKLTKGSIRIVPAGIRVDGISSDILFEPNQIRLTSFKAKSGSGTATAKGQIAVKELTPGKVDISVNAKNFEAANTSAYKAIINTTTTINGTLTRPDISGELQVLSGFVELQNFGEKSVEAINLDSSAADTETSAIYDSLALDMDLSFDRRFFVRNERYLEMEVELDGQVDLLKQKQEDLQMFGSITAASGYARPLGKRFKIEEGIITFTGNPENPSVNVRSLYTPPQPEEEIKIWYIIEGTVEDPKFKYESQPEMELESIISYTLFGQPFYKLDSWQQVLSNSGSNTTAAGVAMDLLLDRVETLATKRLGIDVVKIDNTQSGGQSGTSITTGWYINPKVFFAIQNVVTGSTPDTGFRLEYALRKNLKLILSQGNDSRQGIDLKWDYDY